MALVSPSFHDRTLPLPGGFALLDLVRRRRRWIGVFTFVAASGYGFYELYKHPFIARRRRKLAAIVRSFMSFAEVAALVSSDLSFFLRSNSDQIPPSVHQLTKLSRDPDVRESLSCLSESLTRGFVRALSQSPGKPSSESFAERVLDKMLSPAGCDFASVVAGSFARNLIAAYNATEANKDLGGNRPNEIPSWLHVLVTNKGKELLSNCIQSFVRTAVTVYLENTFVKNTFDEFLTGISDPRHEAKVKDLLVSVCNGAVETLVKTSREVPSMSAVEAQRVFSQLKDLSRPSSVSFGSRGLKYLPTGFVGQVSSTLAVPSNRRLVLDVTGRVAAETVRSFCDFLLQKMSDGTKKSIQVAREQVMGSGFEVVKYASSKSVAIFAICLALCMHISLGTRFLLPA